MIMNEEKIYSIQIENKTIIIRLNRDLIDEESLTRLLDYLALESIRKRSRMTGSQAISLAKKIDRNIWRQARGTIELPEGK